MHSRVFILGSGFSAQVGLPTACELIPLVLERADFRGDQESQRWAHELTFFLRQFDGSSGQPNIESLFDLAAFDLERGYSRRIVPTLLPREQVDRQIQGYSDAVDQLESALVEVLSERQTKANIGKIRNFTAHLTPHDSIISFNYDTLIETGLTAQGSQFRFTLERLDENDVAISLFKMHGSLDWVMHQGNYVLNSAKAPDLLFERTQHPHSEESSLFTHVSRITCPQGVHSWLKDERHRYHTCEVGIVPLGGRKPLSIMPGTSVIWDDAAKVLRKADEIIVIGFSLSDYDGMARLLFARAMHARGQTPAGTPHRCLLIDPRADKLAGAYLNVFGVPFTFVKQRAEDVIWRELLSE